MSEALLVSLLKDGTEGDQGRGERNCCNEAILQPVLSTLAVAMVSCKVSAPPHGHCHDRAWDK